MDLCRLLVDNITAINLTLGATHGRTKMLNLDYFNKIKSNWFVQRQNTNEEKTELDVGN